MYVRVYDYNYFFPEVQSVSNRLRVCIKQEFYDQPCLLNNVRVIWLQSLFPVY